MRKCAFERLGHTSSSWLGIPLSRSFTCRWTSGLRNGGWMWTTVFLRGLAVYLVPEHKQPIRTSSKDRPKVGVGVGGGSHLGARGLQTRYSRLLQQPRVKGFTPPWNFPVTCGSRGNVAPLSTWRSRANL